MNNIDKMRIQAKQERLKKLLTAYYNRILKEPGRQYSFKELLICDTPYEDVLDSRIATFEEKIELS